MYHFNGKKSVILSTANDFGGRNSFMAITYLVVGCVSLVISLGAAINVLILVKKKKTI